MLQMLLDPLDLTHEGSEKMKDIIETARDAAYESAEAIRALYVAAKDANCIAAPHIRDLMQRQVDIEMALSAMLHIANKEVTK